MKPAGLIKRRDQDVSKNKERTAEGMMKNAMRRRPAERRARTVAATSSSLPTALERAGSSAAEMDMLNKLTGRTEMTWPYPRAATAPVGNTLAIIWSM